jgi:hypothetical protein
MGVTGPLPNTKISRIQFQDKKMSELPTAASLCKDGPSFLSSPFDYLIVGGGTAGLVLAARLSENPSVQVGVLEAGKLRLGDANVESMGGIGAMLHNPDYDWGFKTVPQVPTPSERMDDEIGTNIGVF